jgi:hypothetical protein
MIPPPFFFENSGGTPHPFADCLIKNYQKIEKYRQKYPQKEKIVKSCPKNMKKGQKSVQMACLGNFWTFFVILVTQKCSETNIFATGLDKN